MMKRNKKLTVLLTKEELEKLRRAADREGVKMTNIVRALLKTLACLALVGAFLGCCNGMPEETGSLPCCHKTYEGAPQPACEWCY